MFHSLVAYDSEEDEGEDETSDSSPKTQDTKFEEDCLPPRPTRTGENSLLYPEVKNFCSACIKKGIQCNKITSSKNASNRIENAKLRMQELKARYETPYQSNPDNKRKSRYKPYPETNSRRHGRPKEKIEIGKHSKNPRCQLGETVEKIDNNEAQKGNGNLDDSIVDILKDVSDKKKEAKYDSELVEQLQNQNFKVTDEYDPHGRKKTKIEQDLDEAIKQNDFELAEKINDEISERNVAEYISKTFIATSYLKQQEVAKKKQDNKRKKLRWMFDHKERWEVKGNM